MTDEQLYGNEPSWIDYDLHEPGQKCSYVYVTNCGQAKISETGNLLECIFGLGRNHESKVKLEVQIDTNRFRVSRSIYCAPIDDELINHPAMSRSYTGHELKKLEPKVVLQTLLTDDNFSVAAVAVKKTLFKLIVRNCKLTAEEKELCKEIKRSWRKPITGIRKPITKEDLV